MLQAHPEIDARVRVQRHDGARRGRGDRRGRQDRQDPGHRLRRGGRRAKGDRRRARWRRRWRSSRRRWAGVAVEDARSKLLQGPSGAATPVGACGSSCDRDRAADAAARRKRPEASGGSRSGWSGLEPARAASTRATSPHRIPETRPQASPTSAAEAAQALADGPATYRRAPLVGTRTRRRCSRTPEVDDAVVIASHERHIAELADGGRRRAASRPSARNRRRWPLAETRSDGGGGRRRAGRVLPDGFHAPLRSRLRRGDKQSCRRARSAEPVVFKSTSRDPLRTTPRYADRRSSGGMIVDMGIHDFDLARWFMGDVETVARRRRRARVSGAQRRSATSTTRCVSLAVRRRPPRGRGPVAQRHLRLRHQHGAARA